MGARNIPAVLLICIIGASTKVGDANKNLTTVTSPTKDDFTSLLLKKYSPEGASGLEFEEFSHLWKNLLHLSSNSSIPTTISSFNQCAESREIFESAVQNGKSQLDESGFRDICPMMLYQLDSPSCQQQSIPEVKPSENSKKPTSTEVWGYGVLFVTLISLCSLVGVSVLPLMGKAFYSKLLTVLIGLAVGSLSGSSVFHLIPQAFGLADRDPEHRYLQTSALLWAGIWLFFMIERFLKIIMDWKECRQEKRGANHQPMLETCEVLANPSPQQQCSNTAVGKIYESQEQVIKASFGHQAKPQRSHSHEHMIHYKSGDSPIATLAWMIIFGDGFHNFIDGLSLGAAFNESIPTGISISLAVMCEELPHELGDFAVLLSAGMTMRQALIYNFLSACTCYLGLAVGIVLGEFEASQYIFALAGGMFLYISLVDMMPEMNEVAEEASRESIPQAIKVLILQNLGILSGVGALYFLAKYQDQIRFL